MPVRGRASIKQSGMPFRFCDCVKAGFPTAARYRQGTPKAVTIDKTHSSSSGRTDDGKCERMAGKSI
jgi:hypothetical protein